MTSDLKIKLLVDHPQAIPLLRKCFERQWRPYYGPGGPGNAQIDLLDACNRDELPIAMVAKIGDRVCGTAALKIESITTHKHLTPWLAALLVIPEFRRRGVGERLVDAIETKAGQLGFKYIYVGTDKSGGTPESLLQRRGWEFVESSPYDASTVSIFQKALSTDTGKPFGPIRNHLK